jgi:hypothetical protein
LGGSFNARVVAKMVASVQQLRDYRDYSVRDKQSEQPEEVKLSGVEVKLPKRKLSRSNEFGIVLAWPIHS